MKRNANQIFDNSVMDPITQKFLSEINESDSPQIYEVTLSEARQNAVASQGRISYQKLPVEVRDLNIPVGPKESIDIRILRPSRSHQRLPVIMYFHGGGWVLNNRETHDRLIRELAVRVHAIVVFVEYSKSPEARFPLALEEAFAATKWVEENGDYIDADSTRIAVVGDSSGANLATALSLLSKKRGGPLIINQVLFFPTLQAEFNTPSYRTFSKGFFLTKDQMKWFWDQYAPYESIRARALASPLKATLEELHNLPSTLIITAELDVLRDEGEVYARKLAKAGVEVTAIRYLGAIHGFIFLNALASTPSAQAAMGQAILHLKHAFSKARHLRGKVLEAASTNR